MAKIDSIKETLSTLRMLFGMGIVVILAIGGGLIAMYRRNEFDTFFWLGLSFEIAIFVSIIIIGLFIGKKIEEIGEV